MTEAHDKHQLLYANLQDAGLDSQEAECCMKYLNKDEKEKALQLLSRQRKKLLNELHVRQENIDCLDYLTHQLNKN